MALTVATPACAQDPPERVTQALLENEGRFVAELPRLTPYAIDADVDNEVTIEAVATALRLHPWLPETNVWAYDGCVPGPMLVTRAGQQVAVRFRNALEGALPFRSVHGLDGAQATCGVAAGDVVDDLSMLPATTVAHLHGGNTEAASDGWPEDLLLPGQEQRHAYENVGSALFWYHDHTAMATRLTVFAGLAAPYLIRDDIDDALPSGDRELVLVLADRNLETDADGYLTGDLLHKVADRPAGDATGPMEFFGPITLVNGAVWPRCAVEAAQHRVRLLNGANARTFRLTLVDAEGNRRASRITQIGTDGGLLPYDPEASAADRAMQGPWRYADEETLTLAPGERADLIIDFRGASGSLRLVNEAAAPYGGVAAPVDLATGGALDGSLRAQVADVLRFDVGDGDCGSDDLDLGEVIASEAWPTYTRYGHDAPGMHDHTHRVIALVEDPDTGVLTSNEMWQPGDPDTAAALGERAAYTLRAPYLTSVTAPQAGTAGPGGGPAVPKPPRTLATAAAAFHDAATYYPELGHVEMWKVHNLTGDTHPFHIHLSQFQVIARTELSWAPSAAYPGGEWAPSQNGDAGGAGNQLVTLGAARPLERGDAGWKDTVRVNPGEMLALMVRFENHLGRYLYHCHILEHEDHDMMRPFVVVPPGASMHGGMG